MKIKHNKDAIPSSVEMSENWVDERDKSVIHTIYHCETCNTVMELGDPDINRHKTELPSHKMRRVMILKCARCGNVVTDSYAQYSPEKNLFWCKNCLSSTSSRSRREFYGLDEDKSTG